MREPKIIKRLCMLCPLIWTPLVPDFKTPIWAQANNRFIDKGVKGARIGHWPNLFVRYLYRIPLSKYPIWGANHFELSLFVTKINMMHDSPPKLNGFSKFPRARGSADALRHLSRSQKIHPEASRSQLHSSRKVERVPPVLRLGHPASRWGWIWLDVTFTLGTFHTFWPQLNFKGYFYDPDSHLDHPHSHVFQCPRTIQQDRHGVVALAQPQLWNPVLSRIIKCFEELPCKPSGSHWSASTPIK